MDRIEVRGLRVFGRHGVLAHEQRDGQTFVIDLTLELDLRGPGESDALGDTVDYGTLVQQVAAAVRTERFDLIEALAAHLAELCLSDPLVQVAEVRVGKPEAPIDADFDEVAVALRRSR